jgi:hypothetical protein
MARRTEATDFYGGPSLSEAALRAEVVRRAHAAGWKVFSLAIARHSRPVKDAVGYPDLTLARHGEVRFIELKTDSGMLSDDQWAWHDALPDCWIVRPGDLYTDRLGRILA